jgi:hypothetical protein
MDMRDFKRVSSAAYMVVFNQRVLTRKRNAISPLARACRVFALVSTWADLVVGDRDIGAWSIGIAGLNNMQTAPTTRVSGCNIRDDDSRTSLAQFYIRASI